ncbi:MAG: bifunctional (p)ppGpp synthetase/guanosine-3',5'-bis(diphosphate) 3'-pyrophosphohydrolase [Planctomycetes bacterium]|nr:bifunctional (p)ppGpp synthetase/guanosine-3',5'-bis(diphosphate) 3'-pyrophosphohydrolase [Planctomycetota bacterium]
MTDSAGGSDSSSVRRLLCEAAAFAADRHRRQSRKGSVLPYIVHPLDVARLLHEVGGVDDPDVLAAAILHDTIEDTGTTAAELAAAFNARIAGLVAEVTDDKSLDKAVRKRLQIEHAHAKSPAARAIKLADKLSNLRDLRRSVPAGWDVLRVRGYAVWAFAVVEALGPANRPLYDALQELFASDFHVGGETFRGVPETPAARARLLAEYDARMQQVGAQERDRPPA